MLSISCNSHIKSWRNKKDPQMMSTIKSFSDNNNCEPMNYPSEKMIGKNWRNILEQLLLMFHMLKIYSAYVSKRNSDYEKQVILLMIPNGEGWYYLEIKNSQHF